MDVRLPGIDGQSLTRHLRRNFAQPMIVVAFSAMATDQIEATSFDAVVEKPDMEGLADALRRLLGSTPAMVPETV